MQIVNLRLNVCFYSHYQHNIEMQNGDWSSTSKEGLQFKTVYWSKTSRNVYLYYLQKCAKKCRSDNWISWSQKSLPRLLQRQYSLCFILKKCLYSEIFSALYFPEFELNLKIYEVDLRIRFKYGKIWTIKIPKSCCVWTSLSELLCLKVAIFSRISDQ